jgi:hypothetical protein
MKVTNHPKYFAMHLLERKTFLLNKVSIDLISQKLVHRVKCRAVLYLTNIPSALNLSDDLRAIKLSSYSLKAFWCIMMVRMHSAGA